ncbi:MAG: N-acetyl-gamma-glutamyl-phosphate reductase [Solirubrobacterales bacterium]|nr:N-acetyl-gamma-glutamyl-phosphate reductase [Solirubrobacterales bacterium]
MSEQRVIVAGASGFAGALAAELVWRHPRLELVAATARAEAGERLDRVHPRRRVPIELTELDLDRLEDADAAIVSYPHGAATPVVAAMRGLGMQVVDLSADFRLVDAAVYELWYGPHGDPDLLENAVYGLTELAREDIREAELVANPGCYPTAALLALGPLAERGLIASVTIDAKSGVSGAGRGGGEGTSFVSATENFSPYGVDGHRHQPEIEQELLRLMPAASSASRPGAAGSAVDVAFVPHLLPLDQGLLASCYVDLAEPLDGEALADLYADRYAGEPFVEVVDVPPGVRDVRETNLCRLHVASLGERQAVVFAAIDNLWKGAAGQAVQNLNLMLGLDEAEGLE